MGPWEPGGLNAHRRVEHVGFYYTHWARNLFKSRDMTPEREMQKRVGRKLTKRRQPVRASSVQYPYQLREGEDAQEDVTAAAGKPAQYMNQSVFSMITAAGSRVDFNARFEDESSDDEYEQGPTNGTTSVEATSASPDLSVETDGSCALSKRPKNLRLKSAERRGTHLPSLNLGTIKEKNYMSQSTLSNSAGSQLNESPKGTTPRDAPVLSRMLEAQAEVNASLTLPDATPAQSLPSSDSHRKGVSTSLGLRLKEIFDFEQMEDVISGQIKIIGDCITC